MAKYNLKAETGRLGVSGNQQQVKVEGQEIVAGVVVMHNMLMSMARQLRTSQDVLLQVRAMIWQDDFDRSALDQLLANNAELLDQIHVK